MCECVCVCVCVTTNKVDSPQRNRFVLLCFCCCWVFFWLPSCARFFFVIISTRLDCTSLLHRRRTDLRTTTRGQSEWRAGVFQSGRNQSRSSQGFLHQVVAFGHPCTEFYRVFSTPRCCWNWISLLHRRRTEKGPIRVGSRRLPRWTQPITFELGLSKRSLPSFT